MEINIKHTTKYDNLKLFNTAFYFIGFFPMKEGYLNFSISIQKESLSQKQFCKPSFWMLVSSVRLIVLLLIIINISVFWITPNERNNCIFKDNQNQHHLDFTNTDVLISIQNLFSSPPLRFLCPEKKSYSSPLPSPPSVWKENRER